jgi:hypothetical protein
MAGIIAVYGLVVAVLIAGDMTPEKHYNLFEYVSGWNIPFSFGEAMD